MLAKQSAAVAETTVTGVIRVSWAVDQAVSVCRTMTCSMATAVSVTVAIAMGQSVTGTRLAAVATAGTAALAVAVAGTMTAGGTISGMITGSVPGPGVAAFGLAATEKSAPQQSIATEETIFCPSAGVSGFRAGIGIVSFSARPGSGGFATGLSGAAFGTRCSGP